MHWRLENYQQARVSFERAGVDHLAERMARFIEPEQEPPQEPVVEAVKEPVTAQERDDIASFMVGADVQAASPSPLAASDAVMNEPVPVAELTSRTRLPAPLTGRFLISESGYLLSDVADRGFTRLDGLKFLSSEGLSYKRAKRCYRGKMSNTPFGSKDAPMYEIEGNGRLGFKAGGGVFSAISLDDDVAYMREDFVFAFDPELDYENGRVPGAEGNLVHFRGRGSVVLCTPKRPEALDITPNRGVILPFANLVGWFGRVVPRGADASPFDEGLRPLELTGEGALLICLSE